MLTPQDFLTKHTKPTEILDNIRREREEPRETENPVKLCSSSNPMGKFNESLDISSKEQHLVEELVFNSKCQSTGTPGEPPANMIDSRIQHTSLRDEASTPIERSKSSESLRDDTCVEDIETKDSEQLPPHQIHKSSSSTFNHAAFTQSYMNAYYKQMNAFQRSGNRFNAW